MCSLQHQKYSLDTITRRTKAESLRGECSFGPPFLEIFSWEHNSLAGYKSNNINGLHRISKEGKHRIPVEWWFTKDGNTQLMRKRSLEEIASNSRLQNLFDTGLETLGNGEKHWSSGSHSINRRMRHAHQAWGDSPCRNFPIFCSGIDKLQPYHQPEPCQSRGVNQGDEQGIKGNRQVWYSVLDRAPLNVLEDQGISQLYDVTPKVCETGNSRDLSDHRRVQVWLERSLWRPLPWERRTDSHQVLRLGIPTEHELNITRQITPPECAQGRPLWVWSWNQVPQTNFWRVLTLEELEMLERAIYTHEGEGDEILCQLELIERYCTGG